MYEVIKKIRDQLNKWMDEDQKNHSQFARETLQNKAWPFIKKNIDIILADSGEKKDGNWPSSAFAAWLLVQHMDAFPERQKEFVTILTKKVPKHIKLQFITDRSKVNQWILKNYKNEKYYYNGKPLTKPTVDVRDPKKFKDAKVMAKSRKEALDNAIKAGNLLLVDAVNATNAKTQPSYTQRD